MSLGTGITITDDVVVVVEVMWVMLLGVVGILMFVIVYLGSVNVYYKIWLMLYLFYMVMMLNFCVFDVVLKVS